MQNDYIMNNTVYLRAITHKFSLSAEIQAHTEIRAILDSLGLSGIHLSPLTHYWKSPECGELTCQFETAIPLDIIQKQFADTWKADTADSRWSTIHLSSVSFLWISILSHIT